MPSKEQLGIYFGSNSLSLAQIRKQTLVSFFDAPHSLFDDKQTAINQNLPDEIRLTAIIQKTLRDKKIETSEVYLSLPSKDVILRTFFIPWMTSAEVKGVVDFEARRYIPFKLEDLVYNFHPTTIVEKKVRRIRILFIGVRKSLVERYNSILEQSGLKVTCIEPSSISVLRILAFKKQIQRHQKVAIVETNKYEGAIVMAEQNIPQFVRDFRLLPQGGNAFSIDQETLTSRLVNEIKISLDYYKRQLSVAAIDKVIFLSTNETSGLADSIGKNLGIPVVSLTARSLLNLEEEVDPGVLRAYGIGVRDAVPFPVNFNLTKSLTKSREPEKAFEQIPTNYFSTIKTAIACGAILLTVFLTSTNKATGYEQKFATLKKSEGIFESKSTADIEKWQKEALEKTKAYKGLRLKSDVTYFLTRIPELIPKGIWFNTFSVEYIETMPRTKMLGKKNPDQNEFVLPITTVSVTISGYVYLEDSNEDINQVKSFIASLRNDKKFSELFSDIDLLNVKKEDIDGNSVTSFQIVCR